MAKTSSHNLKIWYKKKKTEETNRGTLKDNDEKNDKKKDFKTKNWNKCAGGFVLYPWSSQLK